MQVLKLKQNKSCKFCAPALKEMLQYFKKKTSPEPWDVSEIEGNFWRKDGSGGRIDGRTHPNPGKVQKLKANSGGRTD